MKKIKMIMAAVLTAVMLPSAVWAAEDGKVTLYAVGDNLIHKALYEKQFDAARGVYDFNPCYDNVRADIQAHDLAVINQETIMVSDPALYSDFPAFGSPYAVGDAIMNAGFDVVLSATNHTMDKGVRGITDTLSFWKTNYPEIPVLGLHDSPEDYNSIDYIEKNGIRFAMFNYTYGLNGFSADTSWRINLLSNQGKFLQDVRTAEANADFTICFLHIGEEYRYTPTDYQTGYINSLIDAGADLIICAHPHVVEPCCEVTTAEGNKALVYYSLGNFLSSQTRRPCILEGAADVTIEKHATENGVKTEITSYDFIPLVSQFGMDPHYQVVKLADYSDEMAARHHIYCNGDFFTAQDLKDLWKQITGREVN